MSLHEDGLVCFALLAFRLNRLYWVAAKITSQNATGRLKRSGGKEGERDPVHVCRVVVLIEMATQYY